MTMIPDGPETFPIMEAAEEQARSLSLRHAREYLTAWAYLIVHPSGRPDYWVRITREPETAVDGFELTLISGFRAGRRVAP